MTSRRPTSVTVLSIICIIFGGIGALGSIQNVGAVIIGATTGGGVLGPSMAQSLGFRIWIFISTPLSILMIALLLAGGIGMLMLRPWGRYMALTWSIAGIVISVISLIINIVFLPLVAQSMSAAAPNLPEEFSRIFMLIVFILGFLFSNAIAVALLVLLTRKNVVAAFHPERFPAPEPPIQPTAGA